MARPSGSPDRESFVALGCNLWSPVLWEGLDKTISSGQQVWLEAIVGWDSLN